MNKQLIFIRYLEATLLCILVIFAIEWLFETSGCV